MKSKSKKPSFFSKIARVVPYLVATVLIFGVAIFGSEDKDGFGNANLNMSAMAASNSVSADQLSELYVVASLSSSFSLASTDSVSSNYVSASVLKEISQTSTDKIEKPGYVAVSYSPGIETYIVADGDTMESIAAKLSSEYRTQLTTDLIRWSNNLKTTTVSVGQALSIPKTAGIIYTVKAGDTPETLANRYGAQADRIISYNNLEETGLVDGMSIVLPGGSLPLTERPEYVPVYNYSYYGSTSDRQDMRIAKSSIATFSDNSLLLIFSQIGKDFAIAFHDRTNRNLDNKIPTRATGTTLAGTIFTILGGKFWVVAKIKQSIGIFIGFEDNRAAFTTVTAIRSTFRDINLMTEGDCSIAAFAGL